MDLGLVSPGNFEYDGGVRAARQLLDTRDGSFDAIVCANDAMALGVMDELKRRGVPVPARVAVVGFDDLRMSRYVDPALTTVRQPVREQARRALQVLVGRLQGKPATTSTSLPAGLVIRESCGCPAYRHPADYAPEGSTDDEDLESMRRACREVVAAIRAAGILGAPDTNWPAHLCDAFVESVAGGHARFLGELGKVLTAVAHNEGDVGEFHPVVTRLVDLAQRHVRGDALRRADALLHAARIKVNSVAGRVPMKRRLQVEDETLTVIYASRDLASATDLASVRDLVAARLVVTSVRAFFVCLYDTERGASAWARLLVAHDPARSDLSVPPEGVRFRSDRLLPNGYMVRDRLAEYVAFPFDGGDGASGYAVFEGWTGHGIVYDGLAAQIGSALRRMALLDRLVAEARRREVAEAERLADEMRIATQIQAGMLPRDVRVEGLEVAATMQPATEVAGDYYDVIPVENGCWIGIGDVSGHGLPAGLATLMVHSVVRGVSRRHPDAAPGDLFAIVNAVLYENIRRRMGQEQHATLSLLRYHRSGRLVCAGAHEVVLVRRAADGRVDVVDTPGTWVGLVPDVRGLTADTAFELDAGDLLVLFTDGVTEARNASGEMFGLDRLREEVARIGREPVAMVRDSLLATVRQWCATQEDDLSLVVARHHGKG